MGRHPSIPLDELRECAALGMTAREVATEYSCQYAIVSRYAHAHGVALAYGRHVPYPDRRTRTAILHATQRLQFALDQGARTQTETARILGLSRQRISQLTLKAGITFPGRARFGHCEKCGKRLASTRHGQRCFAHRKRRFILRHCSICGKPLFYTIGQTNTQERHRQRYGVTHEQQWFCSRSHKGQWAGTHYSLLGKKDAGTSAAVKVGEHG